MSRYLSSELSADERGASAVEFALVLPMLLLLVFGIVEFGRAFNIHIQLTGAAREGARVAALESGDPVEETYQAAPLFTSNRGAMTVTVSSCTAGGDRSRVTAAHDFTFVTPLSAVSRLPFLNGSGFAEPIRLTGIGVMRCGG